jgi:hypothetical protein
MKSPGLPTRRFIELCAATPLLFFFFLLVLVLPARLGAFSELFWEGPEVFAPGSGAFPVSAYNGRLAVAAWQTALPAPGASGGGLIRIGLAVKEADGPWQINPSIGPEYAYGGEEPAILSLAVDDRDRILLAAAVSSSQVEILISDDKGAHFRSVRLDAGPEIRGAPRIFCRAGGGYLLFVSRGQERSLTERSLTLDYAVSGDGDVWSPFAPFVTEPGLSSPSLPTHAALDLRDYVVFQCLTEGAAAAQLFLKTSPDGGLTWSPARRITDFRDPVMNTRAAPDRFDNRQPYLARLGNGFFLAWERRYANGSPWIYGASLDADGVIQGQAERINAHSALCGNPVAFGYEGEPAVIWHDNRWGDNRVFLARWEGRSWRNQELSGPEGRFGRPVMSGSSLFVLFQGIQSQANRIYVLNPDTYAPPPRLSAGNFSPGKRERGDRVRISWDTPEDASGILGFSYLWGREKDAEPERRLLVTAKNLMTEQIADEDGPWFFSIIAQDLAGNWSVPAQIEYIRDTTAPDAADIILPNWDERGYLPANTFTLRWNAPPASDIAGYTWNMDYLGPLELFDSMNYADFARTAAARFPSASLPPGRIMGTAAAASFNNRDNGVWRFSVFAIDEAGNIGPPSSLYFRLDKYVPYTYVTFVDASGDEQGRLSVRIIGRGFTDDGSIGRVFLDRDGEPPYDRECFLSQGDYRVLSDREIVLLKIDGMAAGRYRIGLEHPRRGLYLTAPLLTVDEIGTVKFGDYLHTWEPSWKVRDSRLFVFDIVMLVIAGILVFSAAGIILSVRGLSSAAADGVVLRIEAAALISGDLMPEEKKKRVAALKRRGAGLRIKLTAFSMCLVLVVVAMVSAPLYLRMSRSREETLLRGLRDRSSALLEGLASGVRVYLPPGNAPELGLLPARISAISEAHYVTITGGNSEAAVFDDLVWATNDPDILNKIDTAELRNGVSRLTDELSPRLEGIVRELDERARAQVGSLSAGIAALTGEALALAAKNDEAGVQRRADIQASLLSLEKRLDEELAQIGRETGSEPDFPDKFAGNSTALDRRYIFFKPILYRQGTEDSYFRGLIRLEVSVDPLLDELARERRLLLEVILFITLSALTIGALGSLIFSGCIIRPIHRLVSHVELIRDTEDKSRLEGVALHIGAHDELAVLGSALNDMTRSLVKAAQSSQDLVIGKEVQKKFIPLETDKDGNKMTTGYTHTEYAEFFGYYEGAKGVSGDYFDYLDLDGRYFAVIKCDVAGKGIPAALIMIQVATMFLNYFKAWKPGDEGMHIEKVVYQINDFIEDLGFAGRFAAFTLALYDSFTGLIRFCNAGDNIIHWFDASERRMKTMTLRETPAAGALHNSLIEMKGGYTVETFTLDSGDILFLYTDGIEEAKRKFRDSSFKEIVCTEGTIDTPHENHIVGQGDEELGDDRVEAVINAVMNRQIYTLKKYHNGEGDRELQFDFTHCKGTVEEAIMALVSVEKIFRIYKSPSAGEETRVLADKKVDEFLKERFLQYRNYCHDTREYPENKMYMYYTYVNEDAQSDDLTIMGIKRL